MLDARQRAGFMDQFPAIAADGAFVEKLAAAALAVTLPAGQTICRQGDRCSQLALVTAGSARVFKLAESGREITLYRVEPGECCILTASCMLSGLAFPAGATAETDLEAVVIAADCVTAWMTDSEVWRHFLWSLLATRLGDVISLVEEVAFRRMDQRLADYLQSHADQRGAILNTTHSQIAADLGTSREVVSRMLKDLEQRGLLKLSRGRVEILSPGQLGEAARQCD